MNRLYGLMCAGCLLVIPSAWAGDALTHQTKPLMIDQTYFQPVQILPSAPGFETAKGKLELLDIKTTVLHVTSKERELAAKDAKTKDVSFFADTVPGFDIEKLPETKALFNQVRYTENHEVGIFKNHFMRKRPYVNDASIETCVAPEQGGEYASYPSGHATMGYSMGVILSNLIPEKSAEIMDRANLYAENRLICGVHHRSDIIAGQVLGTLIAVQLMQNDGFQKMMQSSRKELQKAGLTR